MAALPEPASAPVVRRWWRSPVLLLLLLTPGIPEYLTGSSSATLLFVSPALFALFFVVNAALYTSGALLIREAVVRWGRGWGSVLLLGAAYGIAEEGLMVHTFFQTSGNPVDLLGSYGHLWGVNWLWALGLTAFHAVYSIALPILLVGLVYPETKGRPLVGNRGLALASVALVADVGLLGWLAPSRPSFLLATVFLAAIGLLIAAAHRLPGDALRPRPGRTLGRLGTMAWLGAAWFPLWLLVGSLLPHTNVPAIVAGFVLALGEVGIFAVLVRRVRAEDSERAALSFATGLLLVLIPWGILLVFATNPVALLLDVAMLYGLHRLRGQVWARTAPPAPPPSWAVAGPPAHRRAPVGG
jgi:hypothetical protein